MAPARTNPISAGAADAASGVPALSDRDRRILEFERDWAQHAGLKEQAVREEFGVSAARYAQIVNRLIDEPAALTFDPMLIKRLRRLRDTRMAARTARLLPRGE